MPTPQNTLFDEPRLKEELYRAYYEARRHKRNTINALEFELDLERNIERLYEEILYGTYRISPSICFIVKDPVQREIFAAHFRDRVVHHYVINQLMQVFENQFIYDTYSCRTGKGTLFGIQRLQKFIRSCTDNYHKEAYVLKCDIRGFFMNINKQLLFRKIVDLVNRKYDGWDKSLLLYLIELIVLNDPTERAIIKGLRSDWNGLPPNKSLYTTPKECGLPIGNLTSQVFANYYLNDFDHYMKETMKLRYYGRYVDDFFVVHPDRRFLKSVVAYSSRYLHDTVGLTLHKGKIYLQPVSKGVGFVGAYIMPFRTYPAFRIRRNFTRTVAEVSRHFQDIHFDVDRCEMKLIEARLNSYLGICQHFRTFRLCEMLLSSIPRSVMRDFEVGSNYRKVNWRRVL